MDPTQAEYLNRRMFDLMQVMTCSEPLLIFLQQRGHIGKFDVEALNVISRNQGNSSVLIELFRRLTGRPGSYESLIEATRIFMQDGALQILEEFYANNGSNDTGGDQMQEASINPPTTPNLQNDHKFHSKPVNTPGFVHNTSEFFGTNSSEEEVHDFLNSKETLDVIIERPERPMELDSFLDSYKLPIKNKGLALILNIVEFDNPNLWKRREGSDKDVEYLSELLVQLGYELFPLSRKERLKERKTRQDIIEYIQQFKERCERTNPASAIIFIGSHGFNPNQIVTSDPAYDTGDNKKKSVTLDLYEDIVQEFFHVNCPILEGRPKIFIVQACQTFYRNETDAVAFNEGNANIKDAIVCTAQLPGGSANRDTFKGSWFIYCLTYMMMKHAKCMSFQEILEMVKVMLGKLQGVKETEQIPYIVNLELSQLYFPIEP